MLLRLVHCTVPGGLLWLVSSSSGDHTRSAPAGVSWSVLWYQQHWLTQCDTVCTVSTQRMFCLRPALTGGVEWGGWHQRPELWCWEGDCWVILYWSQMVGIFNVLCSSNSFIGKPLTCCFQIFSMKNIFKILNLILKRLITSITANAWFFFVEVWLLRKGREGQTS